mmetsp:Transcript_34856/g.66966  ORF Transcript_34856/g.66966 Transcript_34856/m.66966 type:complete len:184 (+) Transcript_34856:175-726(+)
MNNLALLAASLMLCICLLEPCTAFRCGIQKKLVVSTVKPRFSCAQCCTFDEKKGQPESSGDTWLRKGLEENVEDATLYRKRGKGFRPYKPRDNRDKLLFEVREITPPPKRLGLFRLEPSTGCGDMIEARNTTFVIKKVAYKYMYSGGSYKMVSKGADVKETSRDAVEQFMNRMLDRSEDDESL